MFSFFPLHERVVISSKTKDSRVYFFNTNWLWYTISQVDSDEEFEPLFDYTRIQPVDVICVDGEFVIVWGILSFSPFLVDSLSYFWELTDDLDESPVFFSKKQKLLDAAVNYFSSLIKYWISTLLVSAIIDGMWRLIWGRILPFGIIRMEKKHMMWR